MNKLRIWENKSFKDLTTLRIGGRVKYYVELKNRDEICQAVTFAKENKLKIFIIGGGSDILASDNNFGGLVIKYVGDKVSFIGDEIIKAEAGLSWDKLVEAAVRKSLQGIECLSGIPGTVGASPIQNIGAYGQELKNVFANLTAFDIEKEKFVKFSKTDCDFSYRESFFKKSENWQKFIITDVALKLHKNSMPDIKYDSLKNYLLENHITNPGLTEVRNAVLTIRSAKFENPKEVGNAGSFFKNPLFSSEVANKLSSEYPEIPLREQSDGLFKGSAGWFIEKAGWKGKKYKTAGVSPKHALVLINPKGDATSEDLLELSEKIIADVNKKFGIRLEREVQLINL